MVLVVILIHDYSTLNRILNLILAGAWEVILKFPFYFLFYQLKDIDKKIHFFVFVYYYKLFFEKFG